MRICIDARSPGYAGILNYASCLLKNLVQLDQKNEYIVISAAKDKKWGLEGVQELVIPSNNPLGWLIWSNLKLPEVLKSEKVDVYHSLKHITAFRGDIKRVITFHSARFFFLPQHYKWYDALHWRIMYPAAARKYDCIINVSAAEKENYIKYIGVPASKFRVINLAADDRFHIIDDSEKLQKVKSKYNLPDHFLLFVGRIVPVKNIETIIKAYHVAKKRNGIEHKLVIVGAKTWYYGILESLISELDLGQDVIFTGPIFDDLPSVYNLSDLFLFPSYYESFGAVLLEAMACGTPVIAANTGGLPEAAGDAALLISATNIDEFADAIIKLLSSENLRKSLIEKGLARTKRFSWEICARETLNVYEQFG